MMKRKPPASSPKADYTNVYIQPGPEGYLETMDRVGYRIPDITRAWYEAVLEKRRTERREGPVRIVDIGSSYGINSALLGFGWTMERLTRFFLDEDRSPGHYSAAARAFQAPPPERADLHFTLIDTSRPAVDFARHVGLAQEGFPVNLETLPARHLSSSGSEMYRLVQALRRADLFIATGCVGYITEKAFERILLTLKGTASRPVFTFSLLRMFDSGPIREVFERFGYRLLRAETPPVPQRRFNDREEERRILPELRGKGIDTRGLEGDGRLYADLFLATRSEDDPEKLLRAAERQFMQTRPDRAEAIHSPA